MRRKWKHNEEQDISIINNLIGTPEQCSCMRLFMFSCGYPSRGLYRRCDVSQLSVPLLSLADMFPCFSLWPSLSFSHKPSFRISFRYYSWKYEAQQNLIEGLQARYLVKPLVMCVYVLWGALYLQRSKYLPRELPLLVLVTLFSTPASIKYFHCVWIWEKEDVILVKCRFLSCLG